MLIPKIKINSFHYDDPEKTISGANAIWFRVAETLYRQAIKWWLKFYKLNWLKTHRLPVPVISIGNLTTGGTGKTPIVIAMAQFLEAHGMKVAVLSRGYGSQTDVTFHEADKPQYGDEPYLIQQSLKKRSKVYIGKDRVYTGQMAMTVFRPDIILLDDGFQHLRLHRDLDILLVDGSRGFGNGHLLPVGPLREPISSLQRASHILLTKDIAPETQETLQNTLNHLKLDHIPVSTCPFESLGFFSALSRTDQPEALSGESPIILLSGIAQPADFEAMVKRHYEGDILAHFKFTDHQIYDDSLLEPVIQRLKEDPTADLVTTEKDWVKLKEILPRRYHPRVWLLKIKPIFDWEPLLTPFLPVKKVKRG